MSTDRKVKQKASEDDAHLGKKLKLFRKAQGLSQKDLAQALNITFQQVQKYETGKNRMSAVTLYQLSKILNININSFFEGLEPEENTDKLPLSFFDNLSLESIELIKYLETMQDKSLQQSLLRIVKAAYK